ASLCLGTLVMATGLACGSPSFFSERKGEKGKGGMDAGGADSEAGEGTGATGGGLGGSSTGGTGGAGGTGGSAGKASGGTGAVGIGGAGGRAGGATGGSGGSREPVDIVLVVEDDVDDGMWINGDDERLHFADDEPFVEVGGDFEMSRAGFRFRLPIPRGATIDSAFLRVTRR